MGTTFATHHPSLNDRQRCALVQQALDDGTVAAVLRAVAWTPDILADRLNVLTPLVDGWMGGQHQPSPYQALKLWALLVTLCCQPGQPCG